MMVAVRGKTPRPIGRLLVTGVLDVVAAVFVAVLAFRLFGAFSGGDTNPPVCYNAAADVVSCSLSQPVIMLPTFGVTLLVLAAWQLRRWRL
jgi:hypothetical protein